MLPRTFVFPIALSITSLLVASGCTRSDQFKRDQDFYNENSDSYYQQKSSTGNGGNLTPDQLQKIQQPKKKVLVLAFWNDTPVGDSSLGDFAAEELRRELVLSRRIIIPEDHVVTSVTKDFVQGDRVQVTQLVREGRRVGVTTIVVGRISKLVTRENREEVGILREAQSIAAVDIEMKVFDVVSGREVEATKQSGVAQNTARILFDLDAIGAKDAKEQLEKDAIHDAVMKLVPEAMLSLDKMDWQGRVAKIMGNKVYINAGKKSGLLSGDILKVLSPGEEIVDPVTQAYLGRSEGFLKGTLEVSDFVGEDSSMALIHTGGNFQEGDVVRLY